MFCDKCGNEIPDDSYYCDYCGKQINHNIPTDPYRKLTVGECYTEFLKKCFDARGVASFKEFFIIFITFVIVITLLSILSLSYVCTLFILVTFIPFMTLTVRRYHDTNRSGGFSAIFGLGLMSYMARAFTSKTPYVIFFFSLAIVCFIVTLIQLSKPTDPKSRWNPVNGYRE